jgi:hypothetical protein
MREIFKPDANSQRSIVVFILINPIEKVKTSVSIFSAGFSDDLML